MHSYIRNCHCCTHLLPLYYWMLTFELLIVSCLHFHRCPLLCVMQVTRPDNDLPTGTSVKTTIDVSAAALHRMHDFDESIFEVNAGMDDE